MKNPGSLFAELSQRVQNTRHVSKRSSQHVSGDTKPSHLYLHIRISTPQHYNLQPHPLQQRLQRQRRRRPLHQSAIMARKRTEPKRLHFHHRLHLEERSLAALQPKIRIYLPRSNIKNKIAKDYDAQKIQMADMCRCNCDVRSFPAAGTARVGFRAEV